MGHTFSSSSTTKRQQHKLIVKDVEATATDLLQPALILLSLRIPEISDTLLFGRSRVLQSSKKDREKIAMCYHSVPKI